MQNVELRLPVKPMWILYRLQFYSRWIFSQISSVTFLVYTLICAGSWSTDSWGYAPKTGSVIVLGVLGECKISLSGILAAMQTSIRQKRPNLRIIYFRPSKCRLCTVPPGAHAPLCPPSRRHWQATLQNSKEINSKPRYLRGKQQQILILVKVKLI